MSEDRPEIPLSPIKSSAVSATGYDSASRVLAVQFQGGKTYRYTGVPPEVAIGLREAKSVGNFMASRVIGKFEVEK